MHVLIISDLEGISCVENIDDVMDESSEGYAHAQRRLMADVNATIDGAFAGGATKVTVIDGHRTGNNFIKEELDKRAVQVSAREYCTKSLDDIDVYITMGCHAMAGTTNAFLDHTQSSVSWFDYKVGSKSYGEMGQQAIQAGYFDIPLVMVSGDEAACREAKELIPNIATAVVKSATERNKAVCIDGDEALKRIFEAAKDGVSRYKEIKPYKIEWPTTVELTLTRNDYADEIMRERRYNTVRDGRTVRKTLEKLINYDDLRLF